MPAYVIYHYNITDRSRIEELSKRSKADDAQSKYPSKVIAASPVNPVEGSANTHLVMYEFENVDTATKWYYEESSQDVAKLRREITEGWVSIIPGYEA